MQWWPTIGDTPRQGKRQGQAARQSDPPSWTSNVDKGTATNAEVQEVQSGFATKFCDRDGFDGCAKSGQHGRVICRVWRGSTGVARRQAFLNAPVGPSACAADPTYLRFSALWAKDLVNTSIENSKIEFCAGTCLNCSDNSIVCRLCQLSAASCPGTC